VQPAPLGLFDANVYLGPLWARPPSPARDVPGLLATMDAYGLERALVTHSLAKWHHPPVGNAALMAAIAGEARLAACWVVMPSAGGEVPPEHEQVDHLLAAGARAARLCPVAHRLSLEPWEVDPLLEALAERRVPLLVDMDNRHWRDVRPWRFLEWACRAHPTLPLVLLREGQANFRTLYPLMERCPNLILETSFLQGQNALAYIAGKWGAHRLVYGSGLPVWDPGLPISGLAYGGLDADATSRVGAGTLQALLDGCLVR
jgi:predicted TIM-barrel fold metal-dependent hydrolase